jgi:hypothetical protein
MPYVRTRGKPHYSLSAHGSPYNLYANGDYVTVSGNAERVMGNEWLQVDGEAAHLQCITRGFSGAGLYRSESRPFVGMLTDSERDGYIGRRLPLSAIRRYWPSLDDLLPYRWLETSECTAALRPAVADAAVTIDLRTIVAEALYISCEDELSTPWQAIRWVGEEAFGKDSMRRFLVALTRHLDGPARARGTAWSHAWMPDWSTDIATASTDRRSRVRAVRRACSSQSINRQMSLACWA